MNLGKNSLRDGFFNNSSVYLKIKSGVDMKIVVNRRSFLKQTIGVSAGIIGFPYIVQPSALGKPGIGHVCF